MNDKLPESTLLVGIPYVTCAATIPSGSDRYPATVVWVSEQTVEVPKRTSRGLLADIQSGVMMLVPRRIRVRRDRYERVSGSTQDGSATFDYFDGEEGHDLDYSYRAKRGGYVRVGVLSKGSQCLGLGFRRYYYDPHF